MTLPTSRQLPYAAFAALAVLGLTRASAAAEPPAAADSAAPASPPPPAGASPASADATSSPRSDASTTIVGPIEHLGPDAYPNTPVRGITGGSLRTIFHGLQWPYIPRTGIGVGGYAWIDTGYEYIRRGQGDPNNPSLSYQVQQGRFVLRVTPTWSDGKWFAQGQTELVANEDQTDNRPIEGDVDDVWLKVGRWKSFDVQVGRYEAWEIYHFGMGLDLYTLERQGAQDYYINVLGQGPVPIYGVTNLFYRQGGVGQGAVHIYPTPWLRFELGSVYGSNPNIGGNSVGVRPVGIADFGWLKLKAGAEWEHSTLSTQVGAKGDTYAYGAGGSIQFIVDPYAEFGVNYAFGASSSYDQEGNWQPAGSFNDYSVGGFANARVVDGLLLGGGFNYSYKVDRLYDAMLNPARYGDFKQEQAFVALQYHLFKQIFIKAVGGYAYAVLQPGHTEQLGNARSDVMLSGRLRVQYVF